MGATIRASGDFGDREIFFGRPIRNDKLTTGIFGDFLDSSQTRLIFGARMNIGIIEIEIWLFRQVVDEFESTIGAAGVKKESHIWSPERNLNP